MNILLVYPEFPDTFWSFKHALKFIDKKASSPPLGLVTIAAMLPQEWNKKLVDINVTALTDQDITWADMVFISAMVVQRASVIEIIQRVKEFGKAIVAGGPLFTGEWEKFPEVNYFVLNEGEITLPQFLADLSTGSMKRVYATEAYADISTTPVPMWELIDIKKYDSLSIQYSRGCPFNCDFCNVTALLGHRPRTKDAVQIIAELDKMYSMGWRRNIFFVDDNFICNKHQIKEEILPALIEWRKNKVGFNFITEASINLADDPDLMRMMSDAGFISVFVGVETPDERSLKECHKGQNTHRDLIGSIHRLQQYGLQVMGGFIVGFDSDTSTIFQRQVEFIQKSGIVTAMVGILQAPFGTELYRRLKEEGRLVDEMTGDNADGSTNIIPKMGIEQLTEGYRQIIEEIYSPKFFYQRVKTFLDNYEPPKAQVHIEFGEIAAFFRSIWYMGVIGKERQEYWRLFFRTLLKYPRKFAMAITLSIYGFHFMHLSTAAEE
jgi:radical SAM superfamily enzyme YgiQ (UPF0313 family)